MQMLSPEVFELQVARRQEDNKAGRMACQAFHTKFSTTVSAVALSAVSIQPWGSAELPVSHSLIPSVISLCSPIWTPLPFSPCVRQCWQELPMSLCESSMETEAPQWSQAAPGRSGSTPELKVGFCWTPLLSPKGLHPARPSWSLAITAPLSPSKAAAVV